MLYRIRAIVAYLVHMPIRTRFSLAILIAALMMPLVHVQAFDLRNLFPNAVASAPRFDALPVQQMQSDGGWLQTAKITASDGELNDQFGQSVSIDGNYAVVTARYDDDSGTNSGSAYIFYWNGSNWIQQVKLLPSDGAAYDWFGQSASISNDRVIVGAYGQDDKGEGSGAAYVFRRNGIEWIQEAKLLPDDGTSGDSFALSVHIADDTAIIGAPGTNDNAGAAYIFRWNGTQWVQQAKILANDGMEMDSFGWSVAIEDNFAIVGAYQTDDMTVNSGAVYVFQWTGTLWEQQAKLLSDASEPLGYFGYSVSISGNRMIIGAPGEDNNGTGSSTAHVFSWNGVQWLRQAKLIASDNLFANGFGMSVDIATNYAIVGAPGEVGETGSGSAHLFFWNNTQWIEQTKLTPDDGTLGDTFGASVDISRDRIIAGAARVNNFSGSTYIFELDSSTTSPELPPEQKLIASDGATGDNFGRVDMDGEWAVVGAFTDDDNGFEAGSAYVYRWNGSEWVEFTKLQPEGDAAGDWFGHRVSISGNRIIVSARRDNTGGTYAGAAYIFAWNGSQWVQEAKLLPDDLRGADGFSTGVDIDGDWAVVGSVFDDDNGTNSGSAYVFYWNGTGWAQYTKLLPDDGAANDTFGASVGIDGNRIVIGAQNANGSGAAYVFRRDVTTWVQEDKITPANGAAGDTFGSSVGIYGNRVIVGAYNSDRHGDSSGIAYIFARNVFDWQQEAELSPTNATSFTYFGRNVDISATHVVVGAWADGSEGAAYVFRNNNGQWQQEAKLTAEAGTSGDRFGNSVGVDGNFVIVGAELNNNANGDNAGAAYIFELDGGTPPPPPIVPDDCRLVSRVSVCAEGWTNNGSVSTTSTNIFIGDYVRLSGGSITVDTAAGTISGSGTLTFTPQSGDPIPIASGSFRFGADMTASGELTFDTGNLILSALSNLEVDPSTRQAMTATFDAVAGEFGVSGGTLLLREPYTALVPLAQYTMTGLGVVSGNASPFSVVASDSMRLEVNGGTFTADGLLGSGQALATHFVDDPAAFSDLQFTTSAIVDVSADGAINYAGIQARISASWLTIESARLEVGQLREGRGTEFAFIIENFRMDLDAGMFGENSEAGFNMAVDRFAVYPDDLEFSGFNSEVVVPTIDVYGFKLKQARLYIEQLPSGQGWMFEGSAALEVPNFIQADASGSRLGLMMNVRIRIVEGAVLIDQVEGAIDGLSIPLGSTPVIITGFNGGIERSEIAGWQIEAGVDAEIGVSQLTDLLGVDLLTGNVTLIVNTEGWGELEGTLDLWGRYPVQADLSVNKPGESVGGVRGSIGFNIEDVFRGQAQVTVTGDAPYFEGSGSVIISLNEENMPTELHIIFGDITGQAEVYFGQLDDAYGVSATIIGETERFGRSQVNATLDTGGKLVVGGNWINISIQFDTVQSSDGTPLIPSAHVANVARDIPLPSNASAILGPAAPNTSDLSFTMQPFATQVMFYMETPDGSGPSLALFDPNDTLIDASTVSDFSNIVLRRDERGWVYLVDDPLPGDWYMVVTGANGQPYTVEALVLDEASTVALTGFNQLNSTQYQIEWDGADAEVDAGAGQATVSLYYDNDTEGYNGTLIASDLPIDGAYIWDTSLIPTGNYSVYAMIEDDVNTPGFSAYSTVIESTNVNAPPIPTNLAVRGDEDEALVTWDAVNVDDLAGYLVSVTYSDNPQFVEESRVYEPQIRLARPDLTQTMTFTVQAVDTAENFSGESAPVSLAPNQVDDITAPEPPATIDLTADGDAITVNWTASIDADISGYRIYYDMRDSAILSGQDANEGAAPITVRANTSTTLTGLPTGRTYYVRVAAVDAAGNMSDPGPTGSVRLSNLIDNDTDGLPDDFELANWGSLGQVSSNDDSDQDGLNERGEYDNGTNPLMRDSDRDGWTDDDEVRSARNPLDAASNPGVRITTTELVTAQQYQAYDVQLTALGSSEIMSWTALYENLPAGLTLSPQGRLIGSPTDSGYFTVTARVQDAAGQIHTRQFPISIQPPASSTRINPRALMAAMQADVDASSLIDFLLPAFRDGYIEVTIRDGNDNLYRAVIQMENMDGGLVEIRIEQVTQIGGFISADVEMALRNELIPLIVRGLDTVIAANMGINQDVEGMVVLPGRIEISLANSIPE